MPENDLRLTIMLHEDESGDWDDAWKLADYGDGWGAYAVRPDDPMIGISAESASRRADAYAARLRRQLQSRPHKIL